MAVDAYTTEIKNSAGEVIYSRTINFDDAPSTYGDSTQREFTVHEAILNILSPEECPWDCSRCHEDCYED